MPTLGPEVKLDHPIPCPHCGKVMDGANEVGGEGRPTPGDAVVCAYCAGLSLFDDKLNLVAPTLSERTEMMKNGRLVAALAAVTLVRREMRRAREAEGEGAVGDGQDPRA